MTGRVRVMLHLAAPESDLEAVTELYHRVSKELSGTPGLLGNELLRQAGDSDSLIVMSEWESFALFQQWESGSEHRGTTAPLRPYQDSSRGPAFGLYQVLADY
jgi:heme-degrading monooxygenase HmoA